MTSHSATASSLSCMNNHSLCVCLYVCACLYICVCLYVCVCVCVHACGTYNNSAYAKISRHQYDLHTVLQQYWRSCHIKLRSTDSTPQLFESLTITYAHYTLLLSDAYVQGSSSYTNLEWSDIFSFRSNISGPAYKISYHKQK